MDRVGLRELVGLAFGVCIGVARLLPGAGLDVVALGREGRTWTMSQSSEESVWLMT